MIKRIIKELKAFVIAAAIFLGVGALAVIAIYLGLKVQ